MFDGTERITHDEDIIDSRDVIARVEYLRDCQEERDELEALAGQGSRAAADWAYGATLIRDSYFTDYAIQMAEDIGAVSSDDGWPKNCIDWDKAARELQVDYTPIEFDGVTYWVGS